eukprot:jgi/Psemu1/47912/gm1.47912_g
MGGCMSSNAGGAVDGGARASPSTKQKSSGTKSSTKAFQGTVRTKRVGVDCDCDVPRIEVKRSEAKQTLGPIALLGNRLGSAYEQQPPASSSASSAGNNSNSNSNSNKKGGTDDSDSLPAPRVVDPSLPQSERDRQREARLAAAEQRRIKAGAKPSKPPKKKTGEPLRGPNTQPLMRWTAS